MFAWSRDLALTLLQDSADATETTLEDVAEEVLARNVTFGPQISD